MSGKDFETCELPSVSRVLSRVLGDGEFSTIPPDILKQASQRGTAVHEAIEQYAMGKKPVIELEYQTYIDHFTDWAEMFSPVFVGEPERKRFSERLGYKGIADAVITIDGKTILADWKTSSKLNMVKASLQVNMYASLLEDTDGITFDELRILSLTKSGWKWVGVERNKDAVGALLTLYHTIGGIEGENKRKKRQKPLDEV